MSRASQLRQSLGRQFSRSSLLGSSKHIEDKEEDVIPSDPEFQRHLKGEKMNVKAALKRWKKTLQWRQENEVDGILERPYDMFDVIKRYYPQYYCGLTKDQHLLYVERLTEVNLKALRELGITVDDLIHHYIYVAEYQKGVVSTYSRTSIRKMSTNNPTPLVVEGNQRREDYNYTRCARLNVSCCSRVQASSLVH